MLSFFNLEKNNVLSVRNGNSEGKCFCLKSGKIGKRKKKQKSHFYLESQQYIYYHEIEEKYREFSFCLTVFSRVASRIYCYYLRHPVFEQFC